MRRPPRRALARLLTHERRVLLLAFGAAVPAIVTALVLLWSGELPGRVRWTLALLLCGTWLACAVAVHERVVRPLQTLSNMLAALREGDFSLRGRSAGADDALGLALLEANLLGETLRTQRLGALEATALLRAAMGEIDVAVFAFDEMGALRLVNHAGELLLGAPAGRLLGQGADALGLDQALHGDAPRVLDLVFPGGARGRWEVRRRQFRQGGRPHTLLVLADLTRALREEELLAWQRLVRVLGHEINNSLTPIKSIAFSLQALLAKPVRPDDAEDDVRRGLAVIGGRAEALSRFMSAYAQLARLPAPTLAPMDLEGWVRRVAVLEPRLPVRVMAGDPLVIQADGDQLDQLLINLVRNAADAALETGGGVRVGWVRDGVTACVWVEDDGPGLAATANLFVPFFTTKPGGTGIGLVLSRQIAEAHGGSLTLDNRTGARGCRALVRLPI
ncbi:MAG TPA: ATP-binding protein [Gemmatimonadaceae bacterium]|nr:ATP-binding protein [Gemmatimonadaceae bacterium]